MASETETGKDVAQTAAPSGDTPEKKMGRKKVMTASNASAYVLLTIGAVVLVNLIGTRVFGRLDLTENHVYTLAPGSKAIVAQPAGLRDRQGVHLRRSCRPSCRP